MYALFLLLIFTLSSAHESSLENIRQLTFGGSNTRARFGPSGRYVTFQGSGPKYGSGLGCDQIYRLDLAHPDKRLFRMSTGIGGCTNSLQPDTSGDIIYSGTFHHALTQFLNASYNNNNFSVEATCPQFICRSEKAKKDPQLKHLCSSNTFQLYSDYDIFRINKWGNFIAQLTKDDCYNAETAVSPDGRLIAYTSMRSGDANIWVMDAVDGSNQRRLTSGPGYKGGAAFSPDGTKIVFHAAIPKLEELELQRYRALLRYNLIDPTLMEIYEIEVATINGTARQVTRLNSTSSTPTYTPDGQHIIFSSNYQNMSSFSLYLDGGGELKQITHGNDYDAFPMISSWGSTPQLIWTSSNQSMGTDLNIFVADWVGEGKDKRWWWRNRTKGRHWKRSAPPPPPQELHFKDEKHLSNVRQLTFGGQNAEGYFASKDDSIVLQAAGLDRYGTECDQIYRASLSPKIPTASTLLQRLSTGLGVCTCSYYFPDGLTSIHAATFLSANLSDISKTCPQKQCKSERAREDPLKQLCNTSYTWDLFPDYDIFKLNEYGNIIARLTNTYGYDAEGAISPDGTKIVFTSLRSGDPEIWLMDADGGNAKQLTNELGYDGGPFFSPDGTKIGFRASRPRTSEEVEKYKQLLSYNLVEPLAMELFTINVDGTGLRQITHLGGSNWAPFYINDNHRILFSSNFNATGGNFGAFDLYLVGEDGSELQRITFNSPNGFDAFPMMSHNGKQIIWGSSRNGLKSTDLNLFLADWVDG